MKSKMAGIELAQILPGKARWTGGFLGDVFDHSSLETRETLKMALWHPDNSATFENFKKAAILKKERAKHGLQKKYDFEGGTGDWIPSKNEKTLTHQGTFWSDGDCYKYLEGLSRLYATHDSKSVRVEIKKELDELISLVAEAQDEDGYLNTQIQIPLKPRWITRMHHEDYNLGHLFTAAAVHYKTTGEESLLRVARKLADCAFEHFSIRQRDAAYFGWNPTHIPGLVDLYRVTGDKRYLKLASIFLDRRGAERIIQKDTADRQAPDDQNQMAVAFRDEVEAVGHAVTAGYLYLGASEIYRETGDRELLEAVERIWNDIVGRKLYITGAVGALPVGISKRGFKIYEAFGREYQLPHRTAYNETCANITWGMFCRSMLTATGEAIYADEMERVVYNAGISGQSANGDAFNYANPLRWYEHWDTTGESFGTMRHFSHDRWKIHSCYCCPPQEFRFTAQLADWAYYTAPETLLVALYGTGIASVDVPGTGVVKLRQESQYPWDGEVKISIDQAPSTEFAITVRIPSWCGGDVSLTINGREEETFQPLRPGCFVPIRRRWSGGDTIGLSFPMPVRLVSAHPKVEECRGQVALMRGPVVFCAESVDLPERIKLEDVAIYRDFQPIARFEKDLLNGIVTVTGRGSVFDSPRNNLYRSIGDQSAKDFELKLIPYFAWRNRVRGDMTVWLPVV